MAIKTNQPAKKVVAKKVATETVDSGGESDAAKKPESKIVNFYFPKSRGAMYGFACMDVKAVNHIATLDSSIPAQAEAIALMRKMPDLGVKFIELADASCEGSDAGEYIDSLIDMDHGALITLLGGSLELHRLSRGGLIAKALKLA